ncbi:unnamed protein product [Linum tenue]|uniref:Uncharacterized protein n=1 Tax=Linum tenue TaxID=586396 RepID=A0AAV0H0Y9_9ROSI|nr:unnamed protein product [Linum tenue]
MLGSFCEKSWRVHDYQSRDRSGHSRSADGVGERIQESLTAVGFHHSHQHPIIP